MTKTPNFDAAIEKYFAGLVLDDPPAGGGGQWRTCRFSGEKFYVRPEDVAWYKNMKVPLPTLSPNERLRRRMSYYNTHKFFKIPSAYSGKRIIAIYPPDTSYKIYEHSVWLSDAWDPLEYAREYDPTQ